MSLLCFSDFLLHRESSTNSCYRVLKSSLSSPPPTSQTFFTFTLLLGSSVLMQRPECSECHPQRSFSYQAPTTTLHFYPSRILCQFFQIFLKKQNPVSFPKLFLQFHCPEVPVCVCMCMHAHTCVHLHI